MMLKCSKEAFAACPDRHLCGCPEEAVFTEGSECDMFNRQIGSKPMTHGDQIRAMSDEELCEFMMISPPCDEKISAMMKRNNCNDCKTCIMEWLQQPAEVSGDA